MSADRDANEGVFYFGNDVAEIGGRVAARGVTGERKRDSIISRLIMRYRVCLMFRQRRSDWGVSVREKGLPRRTHPPLSLFSAFPRALAVNIVGAHHSARSNRSTRALDNLDYPLTFESRLKAPLLFSN